MRQKFLKSPFVGSNTNISEAAIIFPMSHKTVFDGVEQVSIRPEPIYFVYQLGTFACELSGVHGTGHWSLSDYYNPQGGHLKYSRTQVIDGDGA